MAFRPDQPTDQRDGSPAARTDPQAGQQQVGELTDLKGRKALYAGGGALTGGEARPLLVALATAVVLALVRARWRAALAGMVLLALAVCFPLGTNNDYLLWMTGSLAVLAVGALLCLSAAVPGPRGVPLVAILALACVGTSAIVIPVIRERAPGPRLRELLALERRSLAARVAVLTGGPIPVAGAGGVQGLPTL
jgi:hypothetical protein